jgi:hypothetical protein
MNANFATQAGFTQCSDAEGDVKTRTHAGDGHKGGSGKGAKASGLGGQIGRLAEALNTVGWNHNQVPQDERKPRS